MREFVELFTTQVVPLRRRYGFVVEGVWTDERSNTFAWVVSHDAPDGWDAALAPYTAARGQIQPDPVSLLTSVSTTLVEPLALPPA
jgi:hypothetical protein